MYYDKDFFDWYKHEHLPPPPESWTQLQAVRKRQLQDRIQAVEKSLAKSEAKLARTKRKLKLTTKALTDCQTHLVQRHRQLCVCKIKVLKVPVR